MDSLAKRYASPFSLLEKTMKWYSLDEFVTGMYEQIDEERYWEIYLRTLPFNQYSFDEWRMHGTEGKKDTSCSKESLKATIQKSQDILKGFRPEE